MNTVQQRPTEVPYPGKPVVRFREGPARRLPGLLDKWSVVLVLAFFLSHPQAEPSWMWIGTYSVDDILKNCIPNGPVYYEYLSRMKMGATEMAEQYVTKAEQYACYSNGYSTEVYWHVRLDEEEDVTHSVMSGSANVTAYEPWWYGPTNREVCDMVIYGGHGGQMGPYLGDKAGYGEVTPSDLSMGSNYNRWFISHGCYMFEGMHMYVLPRWDPAFRGLQVALGFASAGWFPDYEDGAEDFWKHWCDDGMGIWPSWYYAMSDNWYGAKHSRVVGAMSAPPDPMYPWYSFEESSSEPASDGSLFLYRASLEY